LVETITPAVSPALAHIIERPRLIARLEEGGGSRVSMFAAPAGYGKTTLARQWSERQSCPVVWYRTNRASGDVALLAVQFDELFTSLAPELPREPGKVAAIAAANPSPSPLGRALVRTFEAITQDILVIVDEWEAAETPESHELLSMIVDGIPVRFVITTRERPDWYTPRLRVYGEGLGIGVDELRMTDGEAAQVLEAAGAVSGRARVMRTAGGWPAVLGLAAMSGEVDFSSDRLLSHSLDEFLAQELLAAAAPETREALMLLAISSIVDTARAELLLGQAAAPRIIADASVKGLLTVNERTSLFFHPLLRDLLIRQFTEITAESRQALLGKCGRLLENRLWDEALSVAEVSHDSDFIANALAVAVDDLLEPARTSSLERWVNAARAAGTKGGVVDYAEAELLLRQGGFDHSLALAACAGDALTGDLAARAHLVAARAAHLGNRSGLRCSHLDAAGMSATSRSTSADLRWLRFAASAEDESPDAEQLAAEFSGVSDQSHDHAIRTATAALHLGVTRGHLRERLEEAEGQVSLADRTVDPYASTSLLNAYSYALFAIGRYRDALEAADREADIAAEFELTFVTPHAEINRASALTALREFAEARRALSIVERWASGGTEPYLASQHAAQSAILAISRGNLIRAGDHLALGSHARASKAGRAGQHALHALVLSALDRIEEAEIRARSARIQSQSVEVSALLAAGSAIRSAIRRDAAGCVRAYEEISELGVVYPLLLAWRARYEVAATLLGVRDHRNHVLQLLFDANDTAIAKRSGISIPRVADRRLGLSAREQEVCELLAQGRTNQEIATMLFISLSTTKVHVKHILEKLGVRSRVEAGRVWEDRPS
jgi:ATP/maltotriose-dependent transcriptional regulator MalT